MGSSDSVIVIRPDGLLGGSQKVAEQWAGVFENSKLITLSDFDRSKNTTLSKINRWKRVFYVLIKHKPKHVVVFMPNALIFLLPVILIFRKKKWIYRESNLPSNLPFFNSSFILLLYQKALSLVSLVVVQSEAMKKELKCLTESKTILIPNSIPIITDNIVLNRELENIFIWAGRFEHQKDPLRAVDVFVQNFLDTDYQLHMFGEGQLRDTLVMYIKEKGLVSRVFIFPPTKLSPQILMSYRGLIFTSHYEGFPNILLEALSAGIVVYSTEFKGGYEELGKYLILIDENNKIYSNSSLSNLRACDIQLSKFSIRVVSEKIKMLL